MIPSEFIGMVAEGAKRGYKEFGVLPSLTIAQAILESGWGQYAPGNMLFGIKWTENCGYDKQLLWTTEYINGKYTKIQDYFRAYDSMADSIYDHAYFIASNSRYNQLLWVTDYTQTCMLIQQCGYATDPNYSKSLIQIIEQFGLNQYDIIEEETEMVEIVETVERALEVLQEKGVIASPDYWSNACNVVNNLDKLLINFANFVNK